MAKETRVRLECNKNGNFKIESTQDNIKRRFFTPDGNRDILDELLNNMAEDDKLILIFKEKK